LLRPRQIARTGRGPQPPDEPDGHGPKLSCHRSLVDRCRVAFCSHLLIAPHTARLPPQYMKLAFAVNLHIPSDHRDRRAHERPTMTSRTTISPQEAADRLAIRELVDAYAHCADRRAAKGQMVLFTEDPGS